LANPRNDNVKARLFDCCFLAKTNNFYRLLFLTPQKLSFAGTPNTLLSLRSPKGCGNLKRAIVFKSAKHGCVKAQPCVKLQGGWKTQPCVKWGKTNFILTNKKHLSIN
jgi:hypothetical protein